MLWKLLPRHWAKKRPWGVCARVDNASSDSEWWRTAKTSGIKRLEGKADLHVRSRRWIVRQVMILFVQAQWPVPARPGPDFICLFSKSQCRHLLFSEGPFLVLSQLCSFNLFLIGWLTIEKLTWSLTPPSRCLAQCWVHPTHSDMWDERKGSVPKNAPRTKMLCVCFGIFLSQLSHGG